MVTPIRGRDQLSTDLAMALVAAATPNDVRPTDTRLYVAELVSLCGRFDLRHTVLLAQFLHETGNAGPAGRWRELNPAGLGITGSGDRTPYQISNGTEAARLHCWSMLVALREWDQADRIPLPAAATSWRNRWQAKYADPACPVVANLEDLNVIYSGNRATWATDPDYVVKIIRIMQSIFGKDTPVGNLIFGRVPHPPYVDKIVTNSAWNDLGPRRALGVCRHSMYGTLQGSYNYIKPGGGGQALWDYSVGGATDGANDGVIWRHNDPKGRRSGWANGGSDGLEGDGPLFVRTLGIDAINRDLVSIERSDGGNYQSQPMSAKQFESISQLVAWVFDQAEVPWNQYPFNPHAGCVTDMIHKEFATKDCPFPPVYNEITRLQNRTRSILKQWQENPEIELPVEIEPDKPIEQDHDRYPSGWTPADLKAHWGVLPRTNPGGSVTNLHFAVTKNPIAAIANAWVHRGAVDGITDIADLPKPQSWQVLQADADTKSDLITFEGGRDAWLLFRPNKWVPWTWIDERALAQRKTD